MKLIDFFNAKHRAGYRVRWCKSIPIEDGEPQIDHAVYVSSYYTDHAAAMTYARRSAPKSEWKSAIIVPIRIEPEFEEFALSLRNMEVQVTADEEEVIE